MATAQATKALAKQELSQADLTALLRASGLVEENRDAINRVKMDGFAFHFGEDDIRISNPKGPKPAFRARLLDVPVEYQAAWIDEKLAEAIGRPNAAKSFCKSFFADERQARHYAEDGTDCRTCPIGPFVKKQDLPPEAEGKRCAWKGDVMFQLLDDNGEISDPTVWTLTMSTTGIIEFKGTGKDPVAGSVSELNFMQKLLRLGQGIGDDPMLGINKVLTALPLGGIIADCYSLSAESDDKKMRWNVPSWEPVGVIDVDTTPALEAGAPAATGNPDDLPF
jgi:hypothetical protein